MKINTILLVAVIGAAIVSCKPKFKEFEVNTGNANFSKFVAIGGSSAAGYSDDALNADGQTNSFVNLLSEQFKLVNGGDFSQPLISSSSVGIGVLGKSTFKLNFGPFSPCKADSITLGPRRTASSGDASIFGNITGPKNNMSVPFMSTTASLFGGLASQNPFYARIEGTSGTSAAANVVAQNPTFFSISTCEEDILAYAISGGTQPYTTISGAPGVGFDGSLTALVNQLTAGGAKGVIGNVPDILKMPYFTTIPWDNLILTQTQADALNSATQGIFSLVAGRNGFIIVDAGFFRKAVAGELILLNTPLDSVRCYNLGSSSAGLSNSNVLTLDEIVVIKNVINSYNTIINSVAASKGLAVADVNELVGRIATGTIVNGVSVSSKFVTGQFYSLDGRNPNPIGQAMLANEYIKAINKTFASSIPLIDASKYRGTKFP